MRSLVVALSLVLPGVLNAGSSSNAMDLQQAADYFREAGALCTREAGRLWGMSLCGPIIFVDPRSRKAVANQPDLKGFLKPERGVFTGSLPVEVNFANTATTWAGVKWTMLIWPPPADRAVRDRLVAHELFHRIQDELGIPGSNPSNHHLDSIEGRFWLRLEWRALREALAGSGGDRNSAITDALVFRAMRRSLFPSAAEEERLLELNEGLAEYTGVRVAFDSRADAVELALAQLKRADAGGHFARSFAYHSGVAYGLLLDEAKPDWRRAVNSNSDFGVLIARALDIVVPSPGEAALIRSMPYGGDGIRSEEANRAAERRSLEETHRSRLIDGPVLVLPLTEQVNYSFNPNNLFTIQGSLTVFPTIRVVDAWGVLEVVGGSGALMTRDGATVVRIQVARPEDPASDPVRGEGWTLTLKEGWRIEPGERPGDLRLIEKQASGF